MALHIRDERALKLAKKLAARRGTTMTQAVVDALQGALAREGRPLRSGWQTSPARPIGLASRPRPAVTKQEIDELWGNE